MGESSGCIVSVLLDTNVFVAAYWASSSASAKLVAACTHGRLQAHYSDAIRREVEMVLRQIRVSNAFACRIGAFWSRARRVEPSACPDIEVRDPDDRKFIEAAVGGQTDFLATNDDHLLSLGCVSRTETVTPATLLRMLS